MTPNNHSFSWPLCAIVAAVATFLAYFAFRLRKRASLSPSEARAASEGWVRRRREEQFLSTGAGRLARVLGWCALLTWFAFIGQWEWYDVTLPTQAGPSSGANTRARHPRPRRILEHIGATEASRARVRGSRSVPWSGDHLGCLAAQESRTVRELIGSSGRTAIMGERSAPADGATWHAPTYGVAQPENGTSGPDWCSSWCLLVPCSALDVDCPHSSDQRS